MHNVPDCAVEPHVYAPDCVPKPHRDAEPDAQARPCPLPPRAPLQLAAAQRTRSVPAPYQLRPFSAKEGEIIVHARMPRKFPPKRRHNTVECTLIKPPLQAPRPSQKEAWLRHAAAPLRQCGMRLRRINFFKRSPHPPCGPGEHRPPGPQVGSGPAARKPLPRPSKIKSARPVQHKNKVRKNTGASSLFTNRPDRARPPDRNPTQHDQPDRTPENPRNHANTP